MGYSRNKECIEKVKEFLDQMVSTPDNRPITWMYTPSEHLAYLIREGLYAARYHNVSKYDNIQEKYRLVSLPGQLMAIPKKANAIRAEKLPFRQTIENADDMSVMQIVSHIINNPSVDEFLFAKKSPIPSELSDLYRFTNSKHLFIFNTGDGVLVTKTDPMGIAWQP